MKELGEVFTTEKHVDELLNVLEGGRKNFWDDEDLLFFEPSCGHGNFVLAIYERRLQAFLKKATSKNDKNPAFYAVANAMNGIFAVDIDPENIRHCQQRLAEATFQFLTDHGHRRWKFEQEFFAHFVCAVRWQIRENELLSALSSASAARETKIGKAWISKNSHLPLHFQRTWVEHFRSEKEKNHEPLEFQEALRFLKGSSAENAFQFAQVFANPIVKSKKAA